MKNVKVSEKNLDFLWKIKRQNKLKKIDDVISLLKEKYRSERRLKK